MRGKTGEVPCQQVSYAEGVAGTFGGVAGHLVWIEEEGEGLEGAVAVQGVV